MSQGRPKRRSSARPHSPRFILTPLWRAFSKVCGYGLRFRRIRVDAKLGVTATKYLQIETNPPDTCRHSLNAIDVMAFSYFNFKKVLAWF